MKWLQKSATVTTSNPAVVRVVQGGYRIEHTTCLSRSQWGPVQFAPGWLSGCTTATASSAGPTWKYGGETSGPAIAASRGSYPTTDGGASAPQCTCMPNSWPARPAETVRPGGAMTPTNFGHNPIDRSANGPVRPA